MFNLPAKSNFGIIFPENNFSITRYTTFSSFSGFYRLPNALRSGSIRTCTGLTLRQTWRGFSSPWPIQTLLIWITFGNEKLLTPWYFSLVDTWGFLEKGRKDFFLPWDEQLKISLVFFLDFVISVTCFNVISIIQIRVIATKKIFLLITPCILTSLEKEQTEG